MSSSPASASWPGAPLRRLGGLSSLTVFHRGLGSNDEAASAGERAERLLYAFPHEASAAEQLRRVAYFEGCIDFAATFGGGAAGLQAATLHKRRYAFLEAAPNVWMALGVVREQLDGADVPLVVAQQQQQQQQHQAHAHAHAQPGGDLFSSGGASDAALRGVLQRLWDGFVLFYGSPARVLGAAGSGAAAATAHVMELKARLRRLRARRRAMAANHAFGEREGERERASAALREAELVASGVGAPSPAEAEAAALSRAAGAASGAAAAASAALSADAALAAEERLLACHVRCVERLSPAAALRRTLRAWLDFAVFHTDWSCLSAPFEGHGALRAHHLQRRAPGASADAAAAELEAHAVEFGAKLRRGEPSVRHVVLAYDGLVGAGGGRAGVAPLYAYLRMHSFPAARGAAAAAAATAARS